MITNNLSTLRIHSLSEEQYNKEKQSSNLENNALYLIPAPEEIEIAQETGSSEEITISQKVITKELNNKNNILSNALKGSAIGEIVSLKDISPVEHNIGVNVSSKNLANPKVILDNGGELQSDGSVYFENANSISNIVIWENVNNDSVICISYQLKTKYFDDAAYTGIRFLVEYSDGTKSNVGIKKSEDYIPITFISPVNKKAVRVIGDYGARNNSTWIKDFQIEIGTAATAYTPYVADIEAVKVKTQGKSIYDFFIKNKPASVNYEAESFITTDTSVRAKGNDGAMNLAWSNGEIYWKGIPLVKNVRYTFSGECFLHEEGVYGAVFGVGYRAGEKEGSFQVDNDNPLKEINLTVGKSIPWEYSFIAKNDGNMGLGFRLNSNDIELSRLQLEVGETATEYEDYKEPVEYTQSEDIKSIYPTTTLTTDTTGALIECEYNRDINKAFAEIVEAVISLGQNI